MSTKYYILAFIYTLSLFSCKKQEKSELVRRLEGIFYDKSFAVIPDRTFNVADFGAVPNGQNLSTRAIQAAIDAASAAGGGKVVFPAGTYLSGAIFVKSNVELNLGEGVIVRAVQDNRHYPRRWTRIAGVEMEWPAALVNVYGERNVRITGKGIIDGNGKYWWDKFWGDPPRSGGMYREYNEKGIRWAVDYDCERVRPVVVWNSEDVLLRDFTVQRAGFWTISLTYSNRVHVDGVVVRNNIGGFGPSSDGIDTDSSKDVLVENCDIDCNDDNLCIKAGKDADGLRVNRPAENIVYRNCITRAGHGLITLGSETSGGMRNIEVYGLEAIGTNTGIRFKSAKVRGGVIENIVFHHIKMKDVANPFHFELNWYPEYSYCIIPATIPEEEIKDRWRVLSQPVEPEEKGIPEFRNILLHDIVVENAEEAFYANAYPEKPIHDIHFENVTIEAAKSGILKYAANWTMTNVMLTTPEGQPVLLENCSNIEQPVTIRNEMNIENADRELTPEERFSAVRNTGATIIPVNPVTKMAVAGGDSIPFSENMEIYVLTLKDARIAYSEPMGDGFYYDVVTVEVKNNGTTIELNGQKSHNYSFIVGCSEQPGGIEGAGSWRFDPGKKQLFIEKTGNSFTIHLK